MSATQIITTALDAAVDTATTLRQRRVALQDQLRAIEAELREAEALCKGLTSLQPRRRKDRVALVVTGNEVCAA